MPNSSEARETLATIPTCVCREHVAARTIAEMGPRPERAECRRACIRKPHISCSLYDIIEKKVRPYSCIIETNANLPGG